MTQLVSILIPAYNAERWLGECLESALAQTWPCTEIIVVDDGSVDRTREVARSFSARGVRVITQANAGAAAARNTARSAAHGTYLQFLDADDLLAPDKIARQMQRADAGHSSTTLLTGAWGRFFVRPGHAVFSPGALWSDLAPVDWLLAKFSLNQFMFPASWLVSRCLADKAGAWDETLSTDDDGEYACRLVAASREVRFVGEARSFYRIGNAASLSSQKTGRAMRSQWRSLKLCIGHLLALEDSERTRAACLQLLQDNLRHFRPEWPELADACRAQARALGGALQEPAERLRFRIFTRMFGLRAAKRVRNRIDGTRLRVRQVLDRLPHFNTHAH